MQLHDALYNWLSIKKVADARPEDSAARDTCAFFKDILEEDHHVEKTEIRRDDVMYTVHYWIGGHEHTKQFPIQLIDALLHSIESEPKYYDQ